MIKNLLNPEGHQNPFSDSKVTTILLKGCICLLVELHWEGSAPAACTEGFFVKIVSLSWAVIQTTLCQNSLMNDQFWIFFKDLWNNTTLKLLQIGSIFFLSSSFKESALLADSFYKSKCPYLCLSLCLFICHTFNLRFSPTSWSPMSKM